jgi:hypothetical protein
MAVLRHHPDRHNHGDPGDARARADREPCPSAAAVPPPAREKQSDAEQQQCRSGVHGHASGPTPAVGKLETGNLPEDGGSRDAEQGDSGGQRDDAGRVQPRVGHQAGQPQCHEATRSVESHPARRSAAMPVAEEKLVDAEVCVPRILGEGGRAEQEQQNAAGRGNRRPPGAAPQAHCPEDQSHCGVEHHRRQPRAELDQRRCVEGPSGHDHDADHDHRKDAEHRQPVRARRESAKYRDTGHGPISSWPSDREVGWRP